MSIVGNAKTAYLLHIATTTIHTEQIDGYAPDYTTPHSDTRERPGESEKNMEKLNTQYGNPIIPQIAAKSKPDALSKFEELKRKFEREYRESMGYTLPGYDGTALWGLATAIARSVLSYLKDPRKRADADPEKRKDTVTNSGMNPAMIAMAAELFRDCGCNDRPGELALLRDAVNLAYAIAYDKNGNAKTEVVNRDAAAAADALITERLGDGVDLAQEAAAALLELAREYADYGEGWLDAVVTVTRPNRKVWIQGGEKPTMETVETAPAKEAYKAVRRAVDNSRAVQADPRNGYSYIEDYATADTDGLTMIYRRLGKYADLGGYDASGNYTTPADAVDQYEKLINALGLTTRQAIVLNYRISGYGYRAIGTKLGVSFQAVQNTMKRVQNQVRKTLNDPAFDIEWCLDNFEITED